MRTLTEEWLNELLAMAQLSGRDGVDVFFSAGAWHFFRRQEDLDKRYFDDHVVQAWASCDRRAAIKIYDYNDEKTV